MKITPFYRRLDFKLIIGLILSLLVVGLPFFTFFYKFHKDQLIDGLKVSTTNLSKLVVSTLETAMLTKEPHLLNDEVKRLSEQSGVERIMILNKRGELKISSDPAMIGKVYKNNVDPICMVCHHSLPVMRKNTTIAKDKNGEEIFRNMSLINNRPRCYVCHGTDEKINGVLVMDLSMADTRSQLASNSNKIFGMACIMILVTSVVLGLLVNKFILRRIKKFTDITHRISKGNLDEVIEFKENDEISNLAKSFNEMTANLKDTLNEVERHKDYLEHVINGIDDEIVVVDRDYNIVTANDAYLNTYKGDRENIIGRRCSIISQNSDTPCDRDLLRRCPAKSTFEQGTLQKTLHTFLDRSGKEKYLEIYCSPLRDERGEVFQVIELRRDITERKFLEEQLIHTEKLTSIGRLAASVAHEINNPLDGIQNCLDIIQKNPADSTKSNTMLKLISEGIERIGFIVRRLLIFSKHHKLKMEIIDLNEVVEKSLLLIKHKIEDQGIELQTRLDRVLPRVFGDPYNLSQVFINIFINASDALDGKTGGCIAIETDVLNQNTQPAVLVRISDNGTGISEENLERIFSPFFTTKDTEKGTGLGLSISKKIVEEHGGRMTIVSKLNEGTTVSVILPSRDKK
ncbi:MAG: PAS domain-containing sensor histidine kinase [bacterium]